MVLTLMVEEVPGSIRCQRSAQPGRCPKALSYLGFVTLVGSKDTRRGAMPWEGKVPVPEWPEPLSQLLLQTRLGWVLAPFPRKVLPSPLSAATLWWRPRGSGSGGDCTPGGSSKVRRGRRHWVRGGRLP